MVQCLHNRTGRSSDEPCTKRLKGELGAAHAVEITEAEASESSVCPLQRVVFIDSTWNQTNKISTDERLQGNDERGLTAGDYRGQMFTPHNSAQLDLRVLVLF